jgi:hypothetical protein
MQCNQDSEKISEDNLIFQLEKNSVPGNLKKLGFKSKSMDISSVRKPCPYLCRDELIVRYSDKPQDNNDQYTRVRSSSFQDSAKIL